MRYRALTSAGDYSFGQGNANFLINSPAAVAQAVKTRLLLMAGEWFLDNTDGTPYSTEILGTGTALLFDQAIRERILDTQGVTGIVLYASQVLNRKLSVQATISTIYGVTFIQQVF